MIPLLKKYAQEVIVPWSLTIVSANLLSLAGIATFYIQANIWGEFLKKSSRLK